MKSLMNIAGGMLSLLALLLWFPASPCHAQANVSTRDVITGLNTPWEIVWGPDNWIWMTERSGVISRVNPETGEQVELVKINDVYQSGESGLLGMAMHPNFADSPFVYVAYTYLQQGDIYQKLVRYLYNGGTLVNAQILLRGIPGNTTHDGSRIVIAPDRTLFMTTGDAQIQSAPQNRNSLNGKILRLNLNGAVPFDNPFYSSTELSRFVWSTGHRNAQGLWWANGRLYSSEHGPNTDDEINIIERAGNYGWPHVRGFCDKPDELQFCEDSILVQPIHAWATTVGVAGLDYYASDSIPEWKNHLLAVTLKESDVRVLELSNDGTKILSEQVYFDNTFGRLRDLCIAPDGRVFVCTSNRDGRGNVRQGDDRIVEIKGSGKLSVAIAKPTTDNARYKAGEDMNVTFSVAGKFIESNIFTVEISDAKGEFASPRVIETAAQNIGGKIPTSVPCDLPQGNYRLRIVSSSPHAVSPPSEFFTVSEKLKIVFVSSEEMIRNAETVLCEGETKTFTAIGGHSQYQWSTGATSPKITISKPGLYTLVAREAGGCTDTATILATVRPRPAKPTLTRNGNVMVASGANGGYQWLLNGEPIPAAIGQVYIATRKGIYSVMVFNEFGCGTASDPVQILINDVESASQGTDSYTLAAERRGEELLVTLRGGRAADLQTAVGTITSTDGRTLRSFAWPLQGGEPHVRSIQLGGIASGRFFLAIRLEGGVILTQPFTVER